MTASSIMCIRSVVLVIEESHQSSNYPCFILFPSLFNLYGDIQLGPSKRDCCVALEASRLLRLQAGRPVVTWKLMKVFVAALHPSISNPTSALRVKTSFPSLRERKFTANLVQRERFTAKMHTTCSQNTQKTEDPVIKKISKIHPFIGRSIGEILTPYFEHSPMTPACDT